jgi:DNA polymerase III subunit delta'
MLSFGKDNLNHAYLLLGEIEHVKKELLNHLESLGISAAGNPDFHLYEGEGFGIGEARLLQDRALGRAFGEKKIFIITSLRFTLEAQNALLKTLEDPTPNTHYFIISREEASIIPTLRSRMQSIRFIRENTKAFSEDAEVFLNLPIKDRLEFAKKFADEEKSLPVFLDQLLITLKSREQNSSIKSAYNISLFAGNRSASSRLVLEHLALVL